MWDKIVQILEWRRSSCSLLACKAKAFLRSVCIFSVWCQDFCTSMRESVITRGFQGLKKGLLEIKVFSFVAVSDWPLTPLLTAHIVLPQQCLAIISNTINRLWVTTSCCSLTFSVDTAFWGNSTSQPQPGFCTPTAMGSYLRRQLPLSSEERMRTGDGDDRPASSQSVNLRVMGCC